MPRRRNKESREIESVRREEASRGGRKPYDSDAAQRQRELAEKIDQLLAEATEAEFIEAVIARGLRPGSLLFETALASFRTLRKPPR